MKNQEFQEFQNQNKGILLKRDNLRECTISEVASFSLSRTESSLSKFSDDIFTVNLCRKFTLRKYKQKAIYREALGGIHKTHSSKVNKL